MNHPTDRLRNYRETLIKLAKRELERATRYRAGSYLRDCHMRSAEDYLTSAKRVTVTIRAPH